MSSTPLKKRPLTDEEVQKEIERLEHENAELETLVTQQHATYQQLCARATKLQQTAEVEEDHIANTLLRRLENEKREKKRCSRMLKAEELAKRQVLRQIAEVRTQQVEIENQVEQEQEFIVNQLQKDLMFVASVKNEAERALVKERMEYLNILHRQVRALSDGMRAGQEQQPLTLKEDAAVPGVCSRHQDPGVVALEPMASCTPSRKTTATTASTAEDGTLVYELEKELNELLAQQVEVQNTTLQQEQECAALAAKLAEIQREALVDRSRAAKLRDELEKAKQDLAMVQEQHIIRNRSTSTATSTPVLHGEDAANGATPPYTGHVRGTTLRSRTLELLSTPTFHPIAPVVHRRTASECSVRSTSPSATLSGYTTDADLFSHAVVAPAQQAPSSSGAQDAFAPSRSSSASLVITSPVSSPPAAAAGASTESDRDK
jgi:hypothetical protein